MYTQREEEHDRTRNDEKLPTLWCCNFAEETRVTIESAEASLSSTSTVLNLFLCRGKGRENKSISTFENGKNPSTRQGKSTFVLEEL